MTHNPQLNRHGELQHLLTIDGLPRSILERILDTAAPFTEVAEREVKKL
ncbi:MAG: aspartate carbamoyltransferase catalytic subunit, partial [Rhodocyclaceae bacterium]|nr:aspartate carbamoyltransferase catalytic subunit [Rhodocyclaceae bacterium]